MTSDERGGFTLSGHLCNTWTIPLDELENGVVVSTQIGCAEKVMDLEASVISSVTRLTAVEVSERTLTMWGDGIELHWEELWRLTA